MMKKTERRELVQWIMTSIEEQPEGIKESSIYLTALMKFGLHKSSVKWILNLLVEEGQLFKENGIIKIDKFTLESRRKAREEADDIFRG